MKTIKKLLFFVLAGCFAASCSNEDVVGNNQQANGDVAPLFISSPTSNTRATSSMDLVNTWTDGDALGLFLSWDEKRSGDFEDKGTQNAKYEFYKSFEYGGNKYEDTFAQEGVLDGSTPSTDWVTFDDHADVIHLKSKYNVYSYFPYVANATKDNIPFTLSATQTQTKPNVWSNETAKYNFSWNVSEDLTRPADGIVPIAPTRLMPVAEFNIVRDDASLDGYYLTKIEMTKTSGKMDVGTAKISLLEVKDYSTSSLNFNNYAVSYVLDTKGDGNGIKVADENVKLDDSFSVYMSVPATLNEEEYTIKATFTNGSDTKTVAVKRTDAYTIEKGKGNIIRYYLKTSKQGAGVGSAYTITYNANGGTGSDVTEEKTKGAEYSIANCTFTAPSGKLFSGWNTKEDGTGTTYYGGDTYNTDANLTLYAQWNTTYNTNITKYDYYQWDAYTSYSVNDHTFGPGKEGFNPGVQGTVASHTAANCPTGDQIKRYIAAGIYWDDGSSVYSPSYTLPVGTYKTGAWLKKGGYAYSSTATSAKMQAATDDIRTSGKYFFLPAAGMMRVVMDNVATPTFIQPGVYGEYWSNVAERIMDNTLILPDGTTKTMYSTYCLRLNSNSNMTAQYFLTYRGYGVSIWTIQ